MLIDVTAPVEPVNFHNKMYRGDILCFRQLEPMLELVATFREFAAEATAPHTPVALHRSVTHEEAIERLDRYQERSLRDPKILGLWQEVLAAIGLPAVDVAIDRLLARVQTPRQVSPGTDLVTAPLGTHRDTWASNMYEQVNWWAPIYEIDEGRTMEVYPNLFAEPIGNSSADFDIVALREKETDSTSVVPQPNAPLPDGEVLSVLIEPGDLLAFSGAHVHRSVPNTTDHTRYSFDTRTIWIEDSAAQRGASNVDGKAPWKNPGWFRRLDDDEPLHNLLGIEATTPANRVKSRP